MTDPEDKITDDAAPTDADTSAEDIVARGRHRPPDLVGTRAEWEPDALLPKETPRAAAGRLWAPPGEDGSESDRETVPAAAAAGAAGSGDGAVDHTPTYSRYSARFQFLLGALLAVGAAAVALVVVVAAGGGKDDNTIPLR
ncbi:MAG TPA: hypothetical protein VNT55_15665, partial [Baekduia sp.]|nr:hypothetical protein [Baekduia sp.]